MEIGPAQSLSCNQMAHTRSRDLHRGLGGPPGEVRLAVVHCGGKDSNSEGPREFFCFLLFCCFNLFYFILIFLIFKNLKYFFSYLFLFYFVSFYCLVLFCSDFAFCDFWF